MYCRMNSCLQKRHVTCSVTNKLSTCWLDMVSTTRQKSSLRNLCIVGSWDIHVHAPSLYMYMYMVYRYCSSSTCRKCQVRCALDREVTCLTCSYFSCDYRSDIQADLHELPTAPLYYRYCIIIAYPCLYIQHIDHMYNLHVRAALLRVFDKPIWCFIGSLTFWLAHCNS